VSRAAQRHAQGLAFLIGLAGIFAIVAITTAGLLARVLGNPVADETSQATVGPSRDG
jgi:hypothetical protein